LHKIRSKTKFYYREKLLQKSSVIWFVNRVKAWWLRTGYKGRHQVYRVR